MPFGTGWGYHNHCDPFSVGTPLAHHRTKLPFQHQSTFQMHHSPKSIVQPRDRFGRLSGPQFPPPTAAMDDGAPLNFATDYTSGDIQYGLTNLPSMTTGTWNLPNPRTGVVAPPFGAAVVDSANPQANAYNQFGVWPSHMRFPMSRDMTMVFTDPPKDASPLLKAGFDAAACGVYDKYTMRRGTTAQKKPMSAFREAYSFPCQVFKQTNLAYTPSNKPTDALTASKSWTVSESCG